MPLDKEIPAQKDTENKGEIETEEHVHKSLKCLKIIKSRIYSSECDYIIL